MITPEVNVLKKMIRFLNARLGQEFTQMNLGPVVEEGLIIGVSIAALLILISVVLAILDNTTSLFNELTNNTMLG
jgi:hypothetical protein